MIKEQEIVVIALGSNIGDRYNYIATSVQLLNKHPEISVLASSNLYECPAVGFTSENFINSALVINTSLPPLQLLDFTQSTEQQIGRTLKNKRNTNYEARTIDIDLLYYGNKLIREEQLILPHPEIENREFVLTPLADLKKTPFLRELNIKETKKNDIPKTALTLLKKETQGIKDLIEAFRAI